MIADEVGRIDLYFDKPLFKKISAFLLALKPDAPDGRYEIEEGAAFAMVSRYETKGHGLPESHREYMDIQLLLSGSEIIAWNSVDKLCVHETYDPARDVTFYLPPPHAGKRVLLKPGMCLIFTPVDAHTPQLWASGYPEPVVKVVVKVKMSAI